MRHEEDQEDLYRVVHRQIQAHGCSELYMGNPSTILFIVNGMHDHTKDFVMEWLCTLFGTPKNDTNFIRSLHDLRLSCSRVFVGSLMKLKETDDIREFVLFNVVWIDHVLKFGFPLSSFDMIDPRPNTVTTVSTVTTD